MTNSRNMNFRATNFQNAADFHNTELPGQRGEEIRLLVGAFCEAARTRDASALRRLLDADVAWMAFGPLGYFPFLGSRSGREAVIETICDQFADYLRVERCESERMLVDGDSAALLARVTVRDVPTGRLMAFRLAQFLTFRDGRVVEMRAILDSFDAVEQARDAARARLDEVAAV